MKRLIKALLALLTPVPVIKPEISHHYLPVWHKKDADTKYAFPDVYCHDHEWFYYQSELNLPGIAGDCSRYEDRICQKCFMWESRLYGVADFTYQDHGKQAFKKLLKMKIEEITTGNTVDHLA